MLTTYFQGFSRYFLGLVLILGGGLSFLSGGGKSNNSKNKGKGMVVTGKKLKVGNNAPDFLLRDQDKKMRSLSEFTGSYIVLYFYPADETPGCTKEACRIRDSFEDFKKNNIIVLGVSYDSPGSHQKFKAKHHLPFILLSDEKKEVATLYGAKRFLLPFPERKTFVIDPLGIICGIVPDVDISTHVRDVMDIIKKDKEHHSSMSI